MQQAERRIDDSIPWIPAVVVVFIIIGIGYFLLKKEEQPAVPAKQQPVISQAKPEIPSELKIPEIRHPVPELPVMIISSRREGLDLSQLVFT